MKKVFSVFLAGLFAVMQVVPAFSYDRTESIESTEAKYDRCDDFYAQSYNNYVVENGFVFDLDTQTIVQFNKSNYIENMIESVLDNTFPNPVTYTELDVMSTVIIPETISGHTVRFIGNYSFANAGLTQIVIPSCVEKIGDRAFEGNRLTNVCLSEGLLEIGRCAFSEGSIVIPKSVKYVDMHPTSVSFTFKNAETKYNEYGFRKNSSPLAKDDIVIDENAMLPVETYRDANTKNSTTLLWCHYTENDGFTYAYPLSISWACSFCGENFTSIRNNKCPYCQETITEEDGTWLTEISNEDYYALYKEKHEGMELREYLIHKLIEANLIVDEKTALVTDDEINTYLEENLVPYHFYWEDGKLASSYYRWIVSYDASLDETPEEITIDEYSARISDFHILDNLDKVETLNLAVSSIVDWMDYHSLTTTSRDGNSDITSITTEDFMWLGMSLLSEAGSYKIFNGCSNIKNVNFCDSSDYGELTDEEMISAKAYAYDFVSLMLKFGFSFDISNVIFTFPDFYDIECINNVIYGDNQKLVIAALRDMNTYEMPSTVTDVCTFAFSQLEIDNFIWGENCLEVPFGCFSKSTIEKIDLKNVVVFEDFAFYKTNIDTIDLPETVTTLGSCVFLGTPVKNMVLPESVKTMGSAIFANCLELKSIVLNSNVTKKLNNYPFFLRQSNKVAGGDLTKIPHTLAIMSFSLYADYGPYDESIFGFVPNLEELYIGKNTKSVSIDSLGYLPSLTTIMIDESNEYLTTYNNFVITREDSYGEFEVLFAPQGANFTNIPTNFPLELFVTEYFKPINSIVASTSHFDLYNIDVNHLYITGVKINDLLSAVYNIKDKNLFMGLFATVPNYLHTNKTGFVNASLENINIPETVTIVRENKEIDIDTDNGAELDVSLRNVSGKLYKIPRWTELTKNDFKYVGESDKYWKFAWYLGSDEFVSINVDLLNEYVFSHTPIPMSSGYYDGHQASQYNFSDSTLKALRFVGDLDLLSKPLNEDVTLIVQLCNNLSLTNLYNLELTPNTVKSLFPDDLEMQSVIDKYTWDDGYLHFTSGGRFPVLQTDSPQQENIINDFIYEFFIPWYNSTYGKMEDYNADGKSLLAISEYSSLKVADMNGIEYDLEVSSLVDDMYFDMLVQSEYEFAQENLSDMLTTNNITNLAEFKQYYIDNYITFDEETQTLINISSVNDGMTPTNLYFPAKINGVEVKRVSAILPLVKMMLDSEVESMYIPSTIESIGCATENIDSLFSDFYLKTIMSVNGITTIEELDAYFLENSGMEFSAVNFNVNDDADLKNGLGILCSPENITISSANKHFNKRTNAIGNTEIVSEDGKICYAVGEGSSNEIYLSGLSTTYAPYSLGLPDDYYSSNPLYYDVMGTASDFQYCSISLVMAVDGYMCPDCGVILNKTRTSCPLCSTTELAVMQMDMNTMEYNYGATWRQEIVDGTAYTKAISNVIAYNENSSFLTHCTDEHDGKACCSYVAPSTLTGYRLTNYEKTVEAYNNPPSEESTTESKGLYNITTDSEDVVTYSDEEFFETQFFVIENQPEQYLDAGVIVVEPFQKTETVTLELKKGTVNAKSIDIDTGELITADFEYGIYSKDDSLVATVTAVDGLATFPDIAYGEYYMKQLNTPSYENLNKTVEFSITEDGQIVDVEFNNYIQTTYTVVIPEYIESVPAGEEMITQTVIASDVVLRPGHTLNITCEYSGELTLREDNDVKLGYKMKNNNDSFASGDVILSCSSADSTIIYDTLIGSILTASPNYAGVYTDTVTFTSSVSE